MSKRIRRVLTLGATCLLALPVAGLARPSASPINASCDLQQSTTTQVFVLGKVATRAVNLTGTWIANDGGTYWIRQIGTCLWWTGFSGSQDTPTMGRSFANVFFGRVMIPSQVSSASRVSVFGYWADVPRGATAASGTLTITASPDVLGRFNSLTRPPGGGFGGTAWKRVS